MALNHFPGSLRSPLRVHKDLSGHLSKSASDNSFSHADSLRGIIKFSHLYSICFKSSIQNRVWNRIKFTID